MRAYGSLVTLMVVSSLAFMGCTSSDTPDTQADNQPTYESKSSKSNHDDVASQEGTQTAPERRMMPAVPKKTSPSKSSQDKPRQTQVSSLESPSGGSPGTADQEEGLLLDVGATAPEFVTIDLAGNPVKFSDWRGKIVILDFWATWCGQCIGSFPQTQDLAAQVKDQDVVVLAVCTSDSRVAYEEFVNKNGERYPDLVLTCDPHERGSESFEERASRKLYGISGLPTQFVIGRDGIIKAVVVGHDETGERLENALEAMGIEVD